MLITEGLLETIISLALLVHLHKMTALKLKKPPRSGRELLGRRRMLFQCEEEARLSFSLGYLFSHLRLFSSWRVQRSKEVPL